MSGMTTIERTDPPYEATTDRCPSSAGPRVPPVPTVGRRSATGSPTSSSVPRLGSAVDAFASWPRAPMAESREPTRFPGLARRPRDPSPLGKPTKTSRSDDADVAEAFDYWRSECEHAREVLRTFDSSTTWRGARGRRRPSRCGGTLVHNDRGVTPATTATPISCAEAIDGTDGRLTANWRDFANLYGGETHAGSVFGQTREADSKAAGEEAHGPRCIPAAARTVADASPPTC